MKNNFLLSAILICAMAICGAFAINVTYASTSAPQVQAIYLEGYNNEKYPNENFTAFVGGVVAIDVESDSELNYYNYDFEHAINTVEYAATWAIVSLVLAIIGGVLVYFLFIKGKDLKLSDGLKKLREPAERSSLMFRYLTPSRKMVWFLTLSH